jgi:hypothetical protein
VTARAGRCGRWDESLSGAPCTFGGCEACDRAPRVIDALHPRLGTQERALNHATSPGGELARLPMNWGDAVRDDEGSGIVRTFVEAEVVDRREGLITLRARDSTLPDPGTLIDGCDVDGEVIATFVMGKRLVASSADLGVAELVAGPIAEVVVLRWESTVQ